MALVLWRNPARELIGMQDRMDRLVRDAFGPAWTRELTTWDGGEQFTPVPLDIHQNDREYVVKAVLPGVKAEDVEVSLVGQCLSLKASTPSEPDSEKGNWLLRERYATSFARTVNLPTEVQADKVEASLEDGILTLRVPKAEAVVPRTIPVKMTVAR